MCSAFERTTNEDTQMSLRTIGAYFVMLRSAHASFRRRKKAAFAFDDLAGFLWIEYGVLRRKDDAYATFSASPARETA